MRWILSFVQEHVDKEKSGRSTFSIENFSRAVAARGGAQERSETLGTRRIGGEHQTLIPTAPDRSEREFPAKKQRKTIHKNLNAVHDQLRHADELFL